MKAMIFAAGVGSRLGELTQNRPKCLMEAGGKTLLEHVMTRLTAAGVTEVVINVHHHASLITRFVEERKFFGIATTFSQENLLLDTGGGLKKVRSVFESESAFLVHNADVYCSMDLRTLVAEHRARKAVALLGVMDRQSQRGLFLNEQMQLIGWTQEKLPPPQGATLRAFSGMSVCSGEIFQYMDEREKFSIIETYLAAARASGRIYGTVIDPTTWIDIGTPERLAELQKRLG